MIGRGISLLEQALRKTGWEGRGGGVALVVGIEVLAVAGYAAASLLLYSWHRFLGLGLDLFVCYSCLALKDLFVHTRPVVAALEGNGLAQAREYLARVVGRDVAHLDRAGIARAGVETLAENFVDGFVSPLFWYGVGGVAAYFMGLHPVGWAVGAMLAFKVASTVDSMVGYRNESYARLGWAGARLDDLMNFLPARLSLLVLFLGAWVARLDPVAGMKVAWRDRRKHDSPNAAHGESFVSGALHVRLGGPTRYGGNVKNKPWLGAEYPDPEPVHLKRTASLLTAAACIAVAGGAAAWLVLALV
jgi:adenosylcobinamide-phosphate synthase